MLDAVEWLVEHEGAEVTWLPVDTDGSISPSVLRDALRDHDDVAPVVDTFRDVLSKPEVYLDRLCRSALEVAARIIRGNIQSSKESPAVTLRLDEAQWLCDVLGLDWDQLHAQAVEANPEPKSWTAKTKTKQEATTQ